MGLRRGAPARLAGLLLLAVSGALAFDLTPDRGELGQFWPSYSFKVFNVGSDNWGPINNCGFPWATAQWRGNDGKRIGSTQTKNSSVQYDMTSITNGWFTPNPQVGSLTCSQSHISRGWQDTYGGIYPPSQPPSSAVWPTYHVRVDPSFIYSGDENPTNNEIWMTMSWNGSNWAPIADLSIPASTKTLVPGDSLFLGVYSTTNSSGTISVTGTSSSQAWSHTLQDGNEKIGYQGRRMNVSLSGGALSTYLIKNGSRVTAEFLGQNVY
jgi:hypothetical protein